LKFKVLLAVDPSSEVGSYRSTKNWLRGEKER